MESVLGMCSSSAQDLAVRTFHRVSAGTVSGRAIRSFLKGWVGLALLTLSAGLVFSQSTFGTVLSMQAPGFQIPKEGLGLTAREIEVRMSVAAQAESINVNAEAG